MYHILLFRLIKVDKISLLPLTKSPYNYWRKNYKYIYWYNPLWSITKSSKLHLSLIFRWEGNDLFNKAFNTFYFRLYGVGHMVKDLSDGLLFLISSVTEECFYLLPVNRHSYVCRFKVRIHKSHECPWVVGVIGQVCVMASWINYCHLSNRYYGLCSLSLQ